MPAGRQIEASKHVHQRDLPDPTSHHGDESPRSIFRLTAEEGVDLDLAEHVGLVNENQFNYRTQTQ